MQEVKVFSNSGKGTSCSCPSILCSVSLLTRTKLTKMLIKALIISVNCKWFHTAPIFFTFELETEPKRYVQNFAENKTWDSHICCDI